MSLIVGSLSSGSSGPSPTISSTMSSTSASSSATFSASRSLRVFSETNSWICRCISARGSFSSATRLISSSTIRWMRSRASCVRLDAFAWPALGSAATALMTLRVDGMTTAATRSPAGCSAGRASRGRSLRVEKRLAIALPRLPSQAARQREERTRLRRNLRFFRQDDALQVLQHIRLRIERVKRHPAIDGLADQPIIVGDAADEMIAEDFLDIRGLDRAAGLLLLEPVDDDARLNFL